MATKFKTKTEAAAAIEILGLKLAGPVFLPPVQASAEGVTSGWYIGFPLSVSKRLVDTSIYETSA